MNFYDIYFWKLFSKPGRYRLPRPRFSPPSTTAKIPVASIPAPASGTNRFPTDRAHRLDEIVRIARLSTAPSLPSIVTHPPRRFSAFGPRFQSWRARGGGRGGELLSADPEVWGCRSSFLSRSILYSSCDGESVWNVIPRIIIWRTNGERFKTFLFFEEKENIFRRCEDVNFKNCYWKKKRACKNIFSFLFNVTGINIFFRDWLSYLRSYIYFPNTASFLHNTHRISSSRNSPCPSIPFSGGNNLSLKQDQIGEDQREGRIPYSIYYLYLSDFNRVIEFSRIPGTPSIPLLSGEVKGGGGQGEGPIGYQLHIDHECHSVQVLLTVRIIPRITMRSLE